MIAKPGVIFNSTVFAGKMPASQWNDHQARSGFDQGELGVKLNKLMSRIRRVSQIVFLLLFCVLLFQPNINYQRYLHTELFLELDPLAAILASVSGRVLSEWIALSIITILLTLVLGRVFCGWVCPMGTTIDLSELAIYRRKKNPAQKKNWQWLKYAVLVAVIFSALFGINLWHFLDPIPLITRIYTMVFYPIVVSGADLLVKGFRPVSEKLNIQSLEYLQLQPPLYRQVFLTLGIFSGIIGLSALSPRFFCQNLCPLGALLGIFSRFSLLGKHISSSCNNCALCEKVCPTGSVEDESWKDQEAECIKCFVCQDRCPTEAIKYSFSRKPARNPTIDLSRRRFISAGFFGLGLGLIGRQSADLKNRPAKLIRPPGALPELEFLARCSRCGECVKVCPTRVIQPQGLDQGIAGAFAPWLEMRLAGCDQQCRICNQVCPTRALRELGLEEKKYAKLGTAELDQDRCLVYAWDKICLICDEICPYNAIIFKTINNKRVPVVIPSRCNGCGWCENACPVIGESAIIVSAAGEIRLRQGSYQEAAQAKGIDLTAADQLEPSEEVPENRLK